MRVTKFRSLNGWTYVVSEGFCVLGYFTSWMAAKGELARRQAARSEPADMGERPQQEPCHHAEGEE